MATSTTIGSWHPARQNAEDDWQVTRALRGGTTAMRSLGELFLPKDWRELRKPDEYLKRLKMSFLFPAYDDTIRKIAARPFQRGVTVTETGNPLIDDLQPNCDRKGTSLTNFSRMLHDMACDRGVAHFLVDLPAVQANSLAQQIELDIRPYFSLVHPDNLINWGWTQDATGRDVLDFVCIYEQADVPDPQDQFRNRAIERIRYWSRSAWQVWQRDRVQTDAAKRGFALGSNDLIQTPTQSMQHNSSDQSQAYALVSEGPNMLGVVPMVTYYTHKREPLTGKPPLLDLAWLNVKHWQTSSQQNYILHYVRAPMIQGKGLSNEQIEAGVTLGAGATMLSTDPNFAMSYLEPSGAATQAGREDIQDTERQMTALGMQPLLMTTGPDTATGKAIDEVRAQSEAQSWAESLEWALYMGYQMAAAWIGYELPEDFDVTVFRDFGLVLRSAQDLAMLQADATGGRITVERYLLEAKRRGLYGDDMDPAEESSMAMESAQILPMGGLRPVAADGEEQPQEAATELAAAPAPGTPEAVSLNELTLGIERLGRLNDIESLNILRRKLADMLGVAYDGDLTAEDLNVATAAPAPSAPAPARPAGA